MIELIIDQMVHILGEEKYGMDSDLLKRITEMRGSVVCGTDSPRDNIVIADAGGSKEMVYDLFFVKGPRVIDPPPILRNGKISLFSPVLVRPPEEEDGQAGLWGIIRAVCRMFSVGDYFEEQNGEIAHCFGLNQYRYRRSRDNRRLETVMRREYPIKNEIFNDAVAWHFMEIMADHGRDAPDLVSLPGSRSIKESEGFEGLVGLYFSGNPEAAEFLSKKVVC